MTPERHQKAKEIFLAALPMEAEQRVSFLAEICAGDEAMLKEVQSLLEHDNGKYFDSQSPTPPDNTYPVDPLEKKYCPECKNEYPKTQRLCPHDGTLLSFRDGDHRIGCTLANKYRIEALVGKGGFGAVYAARHLEMNRRVAFKILHDDLGILKEWAAHRFKEEAKLAGNLRNDNIVTIYDYGITPEGIAYIVMEWLEGSTLAEELSTHGPLVLDRTATILGQIANALEAAHAGGIVHRDLKPANIMLVKPPNGREQVKVLDFGISKSIRDTTGSQPPFAVGTQYYASPEQLNNSRIDTRADIYSLGVILYQMLKGAFPFDSPFNLSWQPLRVRRSEVPVEIEHLINQMLATDPAERPQHISEIPALFDRALSNSKHSSQEDAHAFAKAWLNPGSEDQSTRVIPNGKVSQLARNPFLLLAIGSIAMVLLYLSWRPITTSLNNLLQQESPISPITSQAITLTSSPKGDRAASVKKTVGHLRSASEYLKLKFKDNHAYAYSELLAANSVEDNEIITKVIVAFRLYKTNPENGMKTAIKYCIDAEHECNELLKMNPDDQLASSLLLVIKYLRNHIENFIQP
jgi:serine/threonine protein kinase